MVECMLIKGQMLLVSLTWATFDIKKNQNELCMKDKSPPEKKIIEKFEKFCSLLRHLKTTGICKNSQT